MISTFIEVIRDTDGMLTKLGYVSNSESPDIVKQRVENNVSEILKKLEEQVPGSISGGLSEPLQYKYNPGKKVPEYWCDYAKELAVTIFPHYYKR